MENIQNLLNTASEILAKYEQKKESGDCFNCVDICGVGTIEPRHSEIIAALLEPHGNHGFGAESLKAFFRACGLAEFANNCDDCYVRTEVRIPGRRPDIVISGKDLCVLIENKTNTGDHYMQLADYRDWLKEQKAACKALFYLTYEGYKASDVHIKEGEYQSISYHKTICDWLRECSSMTNNPAADFCRQYADFIKGTITKGIEDKQMTEKILKSVDSFRAAACINKSFDHARFQKLADLVRECWHGDGYINVDNTALNIDFPDQPYKIAVQYDGKTPYYGIVRKEKVSNFKNFQLDGFENATEWWIAWKYVDTKAFKYNWSNVDFLANQWGKDNFASFKKFICACLTEIKTAIQDNNNAIYKYATEA